MREKTGKEEESRAMSRCRGNGVHLVSVFMSPKSSGDDEVRELRKPPRLVEQRSDGLSDYSISMMA